MDKWQEFYNTVKADDWPACPTEADFHNLPTEVKKECTDRFNYVPGKFSLKDQLSKNKSFCIMPFVHLYINEFNQMAPCCLGTPIKTHSQDFDFYTDEDLNGIRQSMQHGERVKECSWCYELEDNGADSSRIFNTTDWAIKLKTTDISEIETKLRYYDVRNDNLCNLACRTCHPGSSTQLEKEYKELKWNFKPNSNKFKLSETVDYDTVESVYIAGGEPTLMPEFTKFLTTAIEKNRNDIALTIITNATNVNKNILNLLSKFKNISFTLSLDGYGPVNRYIRWPSDWDTIVTNIEKLKAITSNISVNVTVSIYNITRLHDLVCFLELALPYPPTILLNQASGKYNIPFNFPDKELAISRLELLKHTKSYHKELFFKEKVDYFIAMIKSSIINNKNLEGFFQYTDALDSLRGIKLIDYIPELDECRRYL
jgi:sulfatase maturation enzyme AslB (radical SAM superfamily)